MCKTAREEWQSLFTAEMEHLWNTEMPDFRMIVIIYHSLQNEFKRVETNINERLDKLKHKSKIITNLDEPECKNRFDLTPTRLNPEDLIPMEQISPKLKRYRKPNRQKTANNVAKNSSSLFNLSKDSCDHTSFSLLKPITKKQDLLDDVSLIQTKKNEVSHNNNSTDTIIDTSIVIDSDSSSPKNKIFKASKSKKTNRNSNKNSTLTQFFHSKELSTNISKVKESENDENKNNLLPKPASNLFQNYDRIPVKKSDIPKHPHKTEVVRGKVERQKLPGWSCKECQEYYEDFDLPEEELREKMNACSKHRNHFQPLNETPKGYWDVTIFSSQDD